MSTGIRSFFKPVCSLPTQEEAGIGVVATEEANRAIQHVLHEQTSQLALSKPQKYTTFSNEQQTKVRKQSAENRNTAAQRKFKSEVPNLGEIIWTN